MLVGSSDEESDDDSEDCSEIDEDERFRYERQYFRRHRLPFTQTPSASGRTDSVANTDVESPVNTEQSDEESNSLSGRSDEFTIGGDGDGRQNHSRQSEFSRGDSSDLSQQIQPAKNEFINFELSRTKGKVDGPSNDPSDLGFVLSRNEVGRGGVESSVRRVGRDDFSNR